MKIDDLLLKLELAMARGGAKAVRRAIDEECVRRREPHEREEVARRLLAGAVRRGDAESVDAVIASVGAHGNTLRHVLDEAVRCGDVNEAAWRLEDAVKQSAESAP